MNDWFQTILVTVVASVASGFGGWIFARKKNAAEAKSVELENVAQAVTIWREAAEKLGEQLKEYNEHITKQRKENELLQEKIEELTSEIKILKRQNCALAKELKELKNLKNERVPETGSGPDQQ